MLTTSDLLGALPHRPVILEAGAHHGEDTYKLATQAHHVYAFEPVPSCYVRAEQTLSDLSNVTLSSLALGGEQTTAEMYVSQGRDDASSSLMAPTEHHIHYPHISFDDNTIEVKVTTIEAWAKHHNILFIDGMWLDMQGAELSTLRSAGEILETVQAIMLEFSLVELYEGCPLWPEVRSWLAGEGFYVSQEYVYPGDYAGEALFSRYDR